MTDGVELSVMICLWLAWCIADGLWIDELEPYGMLEVLRKRWETVSNPTNTIPNLRITQSDEANLVFSPSNVFLFYRCKNACFGFLSSASSTYVFPIISSMRNDPCALHCLARQTTIICIK